jgi:hypothetical protein
MTGRRWTPAARRLVSRLLGDAWPLRRRWESRRAGSAATHDALDVMTGRDLAVIRDRALLRPGT